MPRIDRYVRSLFDEGAVRLALASGQRGTLTVGGEERPLPGAAPTRGELEEMLAEILPPGGDDAGPGRHETEYAAPAGRVAVRAWRTESAVRLIVTPLAASEAGGTRAGDDWAANGEGSEAGAAPEGNETVPARSPSAAGPRTVSPAPEAPPRGETAAGPAASQRVGAGERGVASERAAVSESAVASGDAPAIERLFRRMVEHGCSDLHISSGNPPLFRKDGHMADLGGETPLSAEEARALLWEITPAAKREEFERRRDADFAYEIPGVARFRCNLFMDRRGMGGVFRVIPTEILTAERLGLSEHVLALCRLTKGLVLVTGPTGSGKSTTLAAMLDYVNRTRSEHIITIEDPIEFVHENKRCLINQREVGVHTEGFKVALRAALREDPDVVLVGEMRDLETVSIALETAETGHLVFATLHTNTAPSTVDRIIDQFPADQQGQIRVMLAESLKGVIAQTLCRKKGGGRVAALEVLMVTTAVANLIRESKTFQIPSMMQTGRGVGMSTLNDALLDLVRAGTVELAEAYARAVAKAEFRTAAQRAGLPVDTLPV